MIRNTFRYTVKAQKHKYDFQTKVMQWNTYTCKVSLICASLSSLSELCDILRDKDKLLSKCLFSLSERPPSLLKIKKIEIIYKNCLVKRGAMLDLQNSRQTRLAYMKACTFQIQNATCVFYHFVYLIIF